MAEASAKFWSVQIVTAPGDGVEPAALLTVGAAEVGANFHRNFAAIASYLRCTACATRLSSQAASASFSSVAPLQYLFNVPEGFSRLALEHKCRPRGSLRSLFGLSLQPSATVGLPKQPCGYFEDLHALASMHPSNA